MYGLGTDSNPVPGTSHFESLSTDDLVSKSLPTIRVGKRDDGTNVVYGVDTVEEFDIGGDALRRAEELLPSTGGKIEVQPGEYLFYPNDTYNDPIWAITKPLFLEGHGSASVLKLGDSFDSDSGARFIEIGDATSKDGGIYDTTPDNRAAGTIFKNIKIDGDHQNNNSPYANLEDGHNVTVYANDVTFHNVYSWNATGDGVELWPGVEDVTITGCNFKDCWEQCVHIHGAKHVTVVGNVMDGEVNNGMISTYPGTETTEDVLISNNTLRNGDNHGVIVTSGNGRVRDVRIQNNTITGMTRFGIKIKQEGTEVALPTDIKVTDNTIHRCVTGVGILTGRGLTFRDNDIYRNDANGLRVNAYEPISDLIVEGNEIENNGIAATNYGIRVDKNDQTLDKIYIWDNTVDSYIADSAHTQSVYASTGSGTITNGEIVGNHLRGADNAEVYDTTGSFEIRENDGFATENEGTASVADGGTIAHGLQKTPTFVNLTTTAQGHIAAASAVDGTNITVQLSDDAGNAVGTAETVYWEAKAR